MMVNDLGALAIVTASRRNSTHWRDSTVSWDDLQQWVADPGSRKESGNYLLGTLEESTVTHRVDRGPCRGLHRRKGSVVSRSALALDIDHPEPGFIERVELIGGWKAILHTTFSSTRENPRYRLLVPTDREMAPDEYIAACWSVMTLLGAGQFDTTSAEPNRYMFKPATKDPDHYTYHVLDGPLAEVDDLLNNFDVDLSDKPLPRTGVKSKRDPFALEGVVGAFNRAYADIDLLVESYELPYEPVEESERWHLVGARSVAGMGEVTDGLFYSHHANDPAYGQTCTAFDLVRLHRFAELDEDTAEQTPVNRLPSHEAMLELASIDARVTAELVGVDFASDMGGETSGSDWRLGLTFSPRTGKMADTVDNWDLIAEHEPALQALHFNELTMAIETSDNLPWRPLLKGQETFTAGDRDALALHVEREFRIRPTKQWLDMIINTTALSRRWNPLEDYLDSLEWDGVPRVETCLPGVAPTSYTRMVARKSLVAAVARVFEPGVKWDHTLVLYGTEGIGKSHWITKMTRGYDSNLGRIGDKDTLLAMQRSWVMVSDEGHSLRKSDADATKEFITRTSDVFRMPYDREAHSHPRHCVIWSTTNDEIFLRRQEGNRRYLIVHCEQRVNFDAMTDEYVDQVWAEAVAMYRLGEQLYLSPSESRLSDRTREHYTEEDALGGVISDFLDTPVPFHWDRMTSDQRRAWYIEPDDLQGNGEDQITETCTAQIWVEALGRRFGDHKRMDLLEIGKSLRDLGWIPETGRRRFSNYGPQTVYHRPS